MKTQLAKFLLVAAISLCLLASSWALIVSSTARPKTTGWPAGAAAVADSPAFLGCWEGPAFGGGESHLQFRGDTGAFLQAVTNFAGITFRQLNLVIQDGPHHEKFLDGARVDWEFVIWDQQAWNRFYNQTNTEITGDNASFPPMMPPPQINVFVGGGEISWTNIALPKNLTVRDERKLSGAITNFPSRPRP